MPVKMGQRIRDRARKAVGHLVGCGLFIGIFSGAQLAHAQLLPHDTPRSLVEIARDELRPLHRLASTHYVAGRINPDGLIYFSRLVYQLRLFQSDHGLLKDTYVGFGLAPGVSPAFVRGGGVLELQPLSILKLWASYEAINYFGGFNVFQSFPGAGADFSDSELERLAEEDNTPTKNYQAAGTQLTLGGRLQFKLGPLGARVNARLARPSFNLRGGDETFYDPVFDALVPNEGWFLATDVDVLWITELGLSVGGRLSLTESFFEARHFGLGEDQTDPNSPQYRLGPMISYRFWDHKGRSKFDQPTVLLIANWWIEHRFRTGSDVDQGVPYVLIAFSFGGDLFAP